MQMTERTELKKYLACRARNRVVPKQFPVPPFCITATIIPRNTIHVNIPQFRHRGKFRYRDEFRFCSEFRHRCWFRYRCEFHRRSASSRIPTFHPNPTTRYNPNPNLRHGCFPVAFVLILSSGSKNPVHLAGKRIGRGLRGLKKPCFTGADGN